MAQKKLGRPTEKAMPIRVGFRIDKETLERVDEYCKNHNIERSDLIRKAILQFISK